MAYRDPANNTAREGAPTLTLLPLPFDREDIAQERALAILEGKNPRYFHPQTRRDIGYGLYTPDGAESLWSDPISLFDFEAADKLTDWLLQQTEYVQLQVMAFLDDPSDEQLAQLTKLLGIYRANFIYSTEREKKGSLIDLILRSLPATKEGLYAMARREHPAKRPEAAIRQALRRLTEEGRIKVEGDNYVRND